MNKFQRLEELKKLYDKGLITQDKLDAEISNIQNEAENAGSYQGNKTAEYKKIKTTSRKDIWYASILALVLLTAAYLLTDGFKMLKVEKGSKRTLPIVNSYFQEKEVFPVYLIYLRNSGQGLMELSISNPDNISKTVQVKYGFTKYGGYENQTVYLEPSSIKKIPVTPYSPKFKDLMNPVNATFVVKVTDEQNTTLFSKVWNIKVNPFDEVPWKIKNTDCTNLIASWITPENRNVQELTRKVKQKNREEIVPPADMNVQDFTNLVKDLFNAVKDEGIIFTKSTIRFGEGSVQHMRLPYSTMKMKSANSIDASVLLASLFESAGLRPFIVITSEQAIVGVARPKHENEKIYIDLSLLNRSTLQSIFSFESTFSAAVKAGKEVYSKGYSRSVNHESGEFRIIDVHKARQEGVLPLN